jgi:dolichol kinase
MPVFILSVFAAFMLLVTGEYLHRTKILTGEISRKFVHIVFGLFVATWPYYLDKSYMIALAGMLLVGVVVSYYVNIFTAIHSTRNRFVGEMLYAMGILFAASFSSTSWVFTTGILCLALADGMAAVVGTRSGKKAKKIYRRKTVVGTLTFIFFALLSIGIGYVIGGAETMSQYMFVCFIWLPAFLTFVELTAPWGTDNVCLPVVTTLVLNALIIAS